MTTPGRKAKAAPPSAAPATKKAALRRSVTPTKKTTAIARPAPISPGTTATPTMNIPEVPPTHWAALASEYDDDGIMLDPVYLWERQPWDSDGSYQSFFSDYLFQPPPRSYIEAYRLYCERTSTEPKRSPDGQIVTPQWYTRWAQGIDTYGKRPPGTRFESAVSWRTRATAHERHLQGLALKRAEQRSVEVADLEWSMADALRKRLNAMLMLTLESTEPTESDIVRTAEQVSKLARRATNQATDSVRVDWRKEATESGIDPNKLLESIIAQITPRLAEPPA